MLNAQHAIERYQEQYPAFQDSREYKLIMVFYVFSFFYVNFIVDPFMCVLLNNS